ncbi:hypothetical protein Q7A53_18685 [Halobacillus rhizosphaerae]|uniref:hypothetical protein n=1 Tax=Halobacillus rhizosphaerae TaxID=3064889 RepID=UPI00398AF9DF
MEMIERYIYAVTQRLPKNQREDIAEELRGLIEDMLTERTDGWEWTEADVEGVLFELGNPNELAIKYGAPGNYLISPELFYSYRWILKIVLISMAVSMTVVWIVKTMLDPHDIIGQFIDYIFLLISTGAQLFAWVTIGFAIAEYTGALPEEVKKGRKTNWKPSSLPPLPDRKRKIKKGDAIAGIIFSVAVLVFVSNSNHFLSLPISQEEDSMAFIPFFQTDGFPGFLPVIYFLLGMVILKDAIKLMQKNWTKKIALWTLFINGLTLVVVLFLLHWNPDFMVQLSHYKDIDVQSETYAKIQSIWENCKKWALIGFVLTLLIDTAIAFYHTYKK